MTTPSTLGADMDRELHSQPELWRRVSQMTAEFDLMPRPGEKVAVIGCGTSWFMAQSYQMLRERAGQGVTDAYAASEALLNRDYDVIVAITRSGTTTEVLEALATPEAARARRVGIVGDVNTPIVDLVESLVALPFADESSVVQTRFATTALAFMRASLGEDLAQAIADAEAVLSEDLEAELINAAEFTFLGQGWSIGLAHEAALKLRESCQAWTESYPAKDYRHGPISIAEPGRITWMLGEAPRGLAQDVAATGARFEATAHDPLAQLVRVHKLALLRSRSLGLDADSPRHLTRSVVLDS